MWRTCLHLCPFLVIRHLLSRLGNKVGNAPSSQDAVDLASYPKDWNGGHFVWQVMSWIMRRVMCSEDDLDFENISFQADHEITVNLCRSIRASTNQFRFYSLAPGRRGDQLFHPLFHVKPMVLK